LLANGGSGNHSVFERKPAPDLIRGGYRFAQRKRVKLKDQRQ
jgi:hypothetical protein